MTVTIDKFGRVLIPKPVRDRLGLTPGAELALNVHDSGYGAPGLELRAESDDAGLVVQNGRLVYTGPIDPEAHDIVEILRRQHDERTRKIAGLDRPSDRS